MGLWESIKSTFFCLFEQIKGAAKGAVKRLIDKIKSVFSWVLTKIIHFFKFKIFKSIADLIIFILSSTKAMEFIPIKLGRLIY